MVKKTVIQKLAIFQLFNIRFTNYLITKSLE